MKILGVVGSPRDGGNTEMMRELFEEAHQAGCETEMFRMCEKHVAPCDACAACFKEGSCVLQDDMQELYSMFDAADAIIFGSPVYFGNVSAQLKAVMDRTFSLLRRRALKGKVAGSLVVTRRVGAIQAQSLIYSFCVAHGMVLAGGAIGYGREIGDVLTGVGGGIDKTALEEARRLGGDVVRLAKRLGGDRS